ncbi:Malonate decarboxylase operon regulator (plasmid) [Roseomonas mucosa]|uniref:Malonate decarboxylase operon regulator n=1 Tax=Roseomonas mucosa TaxID=207340 RepID=A0A4Y1MRI0_9PROT|nr:GntR family transcriptional regulator [Roseomonas mucosa]AWV20595.1 Malonate decarboxylase operon regulator [Roseomonas mucosa]MDT8278501.1 GntR family transcriptional regulator [Roseomonas mucosa]MDT8356529.1 GntR family transcriptional regulator [Roseomonas mucosa]
MPSLDIPAPPPVSGTPLPESLPAEIAVRLEADIVMLRLPPGQWLREEEVSSRFGVSRSPVREAMRLLEADGLLKRHPRRGSQVTPLSLKHLDAVQACRAPLEGLAAAGTARHAEREVIASLEMAVEAMAAAQAASHPEAAFHANVRVTGILHAECGNPVLARLLSSLDKQAMRYRYLSYQRLPSVVLQSVKANHALLVAIRSRDETLARSLTEELIQANWLALQQLFAAP